MTLAKKNSINKNIGLGIEKFLVFPASYQKYALLLVSVVICGEKLYSSNLGKDAIEVHKIS